MLTEDLNQLFEFHKETSLLGRYIHANSIGHLLKNRAITSSVSKIGTSVLGEPIYSITVGTGTKKILMWSQMHGNESTTTKAAFDLISLIVSKNPLAKSILESCTLCVIPMLNPDGAKAYTRLNANDVDLNRDAQQLSQPESKALRHIFDTFMPDYCFNLHGQRTIFSAGKKNKPATISFLAPAQDQASTITENRKKAMEIISAMNAMLQKQIPNQVGVYDDTFNINCVGDTFQSYHKPTILLEAGHYQNDYRREVTRKYVFQSLLIAIQYISSNDITGKYFERYLTIPKNHKLFYDIIIRNTSSLDVGIQFQEVLTDGTIDFVPKIEKISDLRDFYAHKEIDARGYKVLEINGNAISEGNENDFVLINSEKLSLKLKKN